MPGVGTDEPQSAVTFLAVEDEDAASRTAARLLITAPTQRGVETVARRIHAAGLRAELPFIQTWACDLQTGAAALRKQCTGFLDAAAGGSMLISDVEEMSPLVQNELLELLAGLELVRHPSAAVRLISGTTVSLLDRVTAGTFSDLLFYRLNVIHVMAGEDSIGSSTPIRPR